MHFVPVALKTHNHILLRIMRIPLLGPLLIVFFGALPFLFLDIIRRGVPMSEQLFMISGGLLMVGWQIYLTRTGTQIKLLFVPMWVWGGAIVIMGLMGQML